MDIGRVFFWVTMQPLLCDARLG